MSRQLIALLTAAGLLLSGCATISDGLDAINPFSSSVTIDYKSHLYLGCYWLLYS
jgi:starvation-inducible outer membrane lipoprotein